MAVETVVSDLLSKPPINTQLRSYWIRIFRGPGHMVNIIVIVFSPLGNYLCLSNREAVSSEGAWPVQNCYFFLFYSNIIEALIYLYTTQIFHPLMCICCHLSSTLEYCWGLVFSQFMHWCCTEMWRWESTSSGPLPSLWNIPPRHS